MTVIKDARKTATKWRTSEIYK